MKTRNILFLYSLIVQLLTYALARGQKLDSLLQAGDSLKEIASYDDANKAYAAAIREALAIKDSLKAGNCYIRLGIIFQRQAIYTKALEYYFKSLSIFEAIHAKTRIASANNNIGNCYRELGVYKKALFYLGNAFNGWSELKDSANIPYALNNIGLVYMNQDSTAKANPYFQIIINDYGKLAAKGVLYSAMSNIASVFFLEKKYDKALTYYQKSFEFTKILGDKYKMALILGDMSLTYRLMDNYNKAIKLQQESLEIAKEIGALELLKEGYKNNAGIYEEMGNYNEAYKFSVKSMELQDTIYNESSNRFTLAEANYEREKKEIEIKNLHQESRLNELKNKVKQESLENKNRLLIISLFVTGLMILIIVLLYKNRQNRLASQSLIEKQRTILLENELKDWELTALRAQMNPHFVFNALSSIKSYMLERNVQMADRYLSKFAKLMRLILDNSSQNFVPLEKELELLESYIDLEQLRFENKFTYTLNVDPGINTMETFIPSMIVQPFVENAIIHGFMHKEGNCHLKIDVMQHERVVKIIVEDNGIGRANAEAQPQDIFHESKGYKMAEQRLQALSKSAASMAGIVYEDLADDLGNTGTKVEILIPV